MHLITSHDILLMRILALRSPGTRGLGRKADAFVPSLRSKSLPQTLFCSFQYNVYSNVLVIFFYTSTTLLPIHTARYTYTYRSFLYTRLDIPIHMATSLLPIHMARSNRDYEGVNFN